MQAEDRVSTVDRSCAHLPEGFAGAAAEAKENSSCLRNTNIAAQSAVEGVSKYSLTNPGAKPQGPVTHISNAQQFVMLSSTAWQAYRWSAGVPTTKPLTFTEWTAFMDAVGTFGLL